MFGSGPSAYEAVHTGKKIMGLPCSYYFIQPAKVLNSVWAGTNPTR
jgi:hypothetical protein